MAQTDPPVKPEYGNFRGPHGDAWKWDKEKKTITTPGKMVFHSKHPAYQQSLSRMTKDYESVMSDYDVKKAAYDKEMNLIATKDQKKPK